MRYLIRLAYNGTHFHGWQMQPNAITVQGLLEDKLKMLLQSDINVVGCGRTDTGVHAADFYAHFDFEGKIKDCDTFKFKLNNVLPTSIFISEFRLVSSEFHARFSATARTYKYYIARNKDPFNENVWLLFKDLNVDEISDAGRLLIGKQDFSAFAKLHSDVNNHICDVSFFMAHKNEKEEVEITITANRFLRNMVRAIVGSLVDVGTGKHTLKDFENIIHSKNRSEAGASAPAKGLFLLEIDYPAELLKAHE